MITKLGGKIGCKKLKRLKMRYNTIYKDTLTYGISATWTKMTSWKHFNICPKCSKKITTQIITNPPMYRCECITDEEWNSQ